jgi:RNA polymerase sigma factor (sigma-70 family)
MSILTRSGTVRAGEPEIDPGSLSDRLKLNDLLDRIANQDRNALREVYYLTSRKLFGTCLRITGDRQSAEDILHDTYLKIWARAQTWDGARGTAMTWMLAIARNKSLDWRRAQTIRVGLAEDVTEIGEPRPCAFEYLLQQESARHIRSCISTLSYEQQHAILAAFFHGATYPELAKYTGAPLATIKSRVRRGLATLRQQLLLADHQQAQYNH